MSVEITEFEQLAEQAGRYAYQHSQINPEPLPVGGGLDQNWAAHQRATMVMQAAARRGKLVWEDVLREQYHDVFVTADPVQQKEKLVALAGLSLRVAASIKTD